MGRRRSYTPEEREARRQSDQAHRQAADALLEDPQRVEAMYQQVAALPEHSRIHSYSERNRALLYTQAEQRGMTLTDVAGVVAWSKRGRRVITGQRGLRITASHGNQDQDQKQEREQGQQETGEQQGKNRPTRFRMVSVFDVSQTRLDTDEVPARTSERSAA